jgi:hypothetical protein
MKKHYYKSIEEVSLSTDYHGLNWILGDPEVEVRIETTASTFGVCG